MADQPPARVAHIFARQNFGGADLRVRSRSDFSPQGSPPTSSTAPMWRRGLFLLDGGQRRGRQLRRLGQYAFATQLAALIVHVSLPSESSESWYVTLATIVVRSRDICHHPPVAAP